MFFWNSNNLETSNIFVIINTFAQLGYIATTLEPLDRTSTPNWLTHIVAKTFAGIGVLDLLHNTSAAYYRGVPPSGLVQIATGVEFPKDSSAKILTSGLLGDQYIGIDPGADDKNFAAGDIIKQTQSAIVLENLIGQVLLSKAGDAGAESGDNK